VKRKAAWARSGCTSHVAVSVSYAPVLHLTVLLSVQRLAHAQGDFKDWFWMATATALYTYLSACLFLIYLHLYEAAGFMTIADYFYK
jgi:hypothetical protein